MESMNSPDLLRELVDELLIEDRRRAREEEERARGYLTGEGLLQAKEKKYFERLQMQAISQSWEMAFSILQNEKPKLFQKLSSAIQTLSSEKPRGELYEQMNLSEEELGEIELLTLNSVKEGDFEQGKSLFFLLVTLHPTEALFWTKLGLILKVTAAPIEAAECFSLALLLDPSHLPTLFFLADCTWRLGWQERAKEALDEARQLLSEEGFPAPWEDLVDGLYQRLSETVVGREREREVLHDEEVLVLKKRTELSGVLSYAQMKEVMEETPSKVYALFSSECLVVHHDPQSDWAKRFGEVQFPKQVNESLWESAGYSSGFPVILQAGTFDLLRGVVRGQEDVKLSRVEEIFSRNEWKGYDLYLQARDAEGEPLLFYREGKGKVSWEKGKVPVSATVRRLQLRKAHPVLILRKPGFGAALKKLDLTRGSLWVLILASGEHELGMRWMVNRLKLLQVRFSET